MLVNFRQERLLKERRQKLFGALFLIFLVFLFSRGFVISSLGRMLHIIGIPFWDARNSMSETTLYVEQYMRPRNDLVSDVLALKEKVAEMESATIEVKQLLLENEELKAELGRKEHTNRVLAKVLSKPPFEVYDTMVIDLGESDGVLVGANVFAHGAYVIGNVTRVFDTTAIVTLATAPGETRVASVARAPTLSGDKDDIEKYELLFTGIGGGGFRAQVPKHMRIASGTPMVLSLGKQSYLGTISGEHIPDGGSLKTVYGSLPFGLNGLRWVMVEKK